ncbi:hypothetical protein [Ralstonia sp.]|uniref:hypothetical protein n=1 Tax=Ralstonia sp. TaxID=54061 RepID=UPI0031DEF3EA
MDGEYVASFQIETFTEAAEDVLRRRGITSIAFNDPSKIVFVYTGKRITQKEQEFLPNFIGECAIHYPHGSVDDLAPADVQAQGSSVTLLPGPNGLQRYCCGSSISPGNEASAGTLGALVIDSQQQLYGLSNNHVTGGCNHSAPGLPILAPGVKDVTADVISPFTIGYHHQVLPYAVGTSGNVDITLNTDAAIFKIANPTLVSSLQGGTFDTPTQAVAPVEGMRVAKVGRTTGYTEGQIVGRVLRPLKVKAASPANQFEGRIWFPNAFVIHGDQREFSEAGDSGALVVSLNDDGTKSAVGLVFCGGADSKAPGNKRSLIVPLAPILQRLGVSLVSGHNVST